tara:strand:- start:388 stop:1080 length:693 start_codon:yes stop_codon:yes gene_type:complete
MKFFSFLFLLFSFALFSQKNSNTQNLYKKFDSIVNLKNTSLPYGKVFTEKYRTKENNHQYFDVNQFVIGEVSYQNQAFFDVKIKYDINEDDLIVTVDTDFENYSIILEKAFVEKFKINTKTFINTNEFGYLEILFDSNEISFFKKNTKSKQKKEDKSFVYFKFSEKNQYYLSYKEVYYKITRKKDIHEILPNQKNNISSFYKLNKELMKNDIDKFYQLLSKTIVNNLKSN